MLFRSLVAVVEEELHEGREEAAAVGEVVASCTSRKLRGWLLVDLLVHTVEIWGVGEPRLRPNPRQPEIGA